MDHSDQIFQMVKQYNTKKSANGKEYVVNRLRNSFRYINKIDQKLTMALFVVLELNRSRNIDFKDLLDKVVCLTNLNKNDVFEELPRQMADYFTMVG